MTTNSAIKIQLNSEAAIRTLIDNDPALQFEIKNKIACAIAHGYEKINTETINQSVETLTHEVSNKVYESLTVLKQEGYKRPTRVLSPEVQALIRESVTASIKEYVDNSIREAHDRLYATINEKINFMADNIIHEITEDVFDNRVRRAVDKKLNEIQKNIAAEMVK